MNQDKLTRMYKQTLEEKIIRYLAERKHIDLIDAMDIYYRSKLATQIEAGACGIENLDYKYLAEDLIENESELFIQDKGVAESTT